MCFHLQRGGHGQGGGNMNMQPGLGIIPTLFGFQQNQGERRRNAEPKVYGTGCSVLSYACSSTFVQYVMPTLTNVPRLTALQVRVATQNP